MKKFKVDKKYRKNELSFKDGGVTVFVHYKSGVIKEYDNIHYPDKFIGTISESNKPNIINIWWELPLYTIFDDPESGYSEL